MQRYKNYKIPQHIKQKLNNKDIDKLNLKGLPVNHVQDCMYQESIDLLNQTAELKDTFADIPNIITISDIVLHATHTSMQCAQNHKYQSSFQLLDIAHAALSAAKKTAAGITYLCKRTMQGFEAAGDEIKSIINSPPPTFFRSHATCMHPLPGRKSPTVLPYVFSTQLFLQRLLQNTAPRN